MTSNDLKRKHGLFDESNQTETDANKLTVENILESERLSGNASCHTVKGFDFVEKCKDLVHLGKAKQVALKHLKTINDFSYKGINC